MNTIYLCLCTCICVYTYMCMHVCIYIYTHIHAHIYYLLYLQVNLLKFHFAVNQNIPSLSHPNGYRSYPAKSVQCLVSENKKTLEVNLCNTYIF